MANTKVFIGSSKKNLKVAKLLAECLEGSAQVTVWDENVFGLNHNYLETLLAQLDEYDFAVFVLAPDDLITTPSETQPSPRDNVLFESGLFMGQLGRERVFLVYDAAVQLKIPSDLAGITLASYDGSRIDKEPQAAIRAACRKISEAITAARFPHLVGDWKSVYPMTFEDGYPMIDEVLEIRPGRNGLTFSTKTSSLDDFYMGFGRLTCERQIQGRWKSRLDLNDMEGLFMLTVNPASTVMYGYFTTPNETGGTVFAGWVLAKIAGTDEAVLNARLQKAQQLLKTITIFEPKATEPE